MYKTNTTIYYLLTGENMLVHKDLSYGQLKLENVNISNGPRCRLINSEKESLCVFLRISKDIISDNTTR